MTVRSRYWLAAVLGVCMVHPLWAGEPTRLEIPAAPNLSPRPELTPNQQLANTIAGQLRQSGQLRRYNVDVTCRDGAVELDGTVTDQMQREEVLRLVQGVPGVERVRDRLRVIRLGPVAQAQAAIPPVANGPELTPVPKKDAAESGPTANGGASVEPVPIYQAPGAPYDLNPPKMPPYAWPTYAPYNNFSRVAYPTLYPYNAWPFIGPVYPFPKVPLGWRSVKLQWQDGHWWFGKTATGHDWWRLRYW